MYISAERFFFALPFQGHGWPWSLVLGQRHAVSFAFLDMIQGGCLPKAYSKHHWFGLDEVGVQSLLFLTQSSPCVPSLLLSSDGSPIIIYSGSAFIMLEVTASTSEGRHIESWDIHHRISRASLR